MKLSVDTRDFLRLEADLGKFARHAIPHAQRNTLNAAAKTTEKVAKVHVDKKMTLRAPNNWTKGSIRHKRARGTNTRSMFSAVGSVQKYMADQEFGSTKRAKGKVGTPLTTPYASGEGLNAKPRKKLARKPNKLRNIRLRKTRRRGVNRKQRTIIAIAEAAKAKRRYVYLDTGKRKGIFRLHGSLARRRGGEGEYKPKLRLYRPELRMVQDLTYKSVRIPRNPWLKPSVDKVRPAMGMIYF